MKTQPIKTSKQFNKECERYGHDPKSLMEKHYYNPKLEILDCDNLLDYADGYLNIRFNGDDSIESFLFLDGILEESSYIK